MCIGNPCSIQSERGEKQFLTSARQQLEFKLRNNKTNFLFKKNNKLRNDWVIICNITKVMTSLSGYLYAINS